MNKDERKTRGSVLNGYLNYIGRRWGKEGNESCMAHVGLGDVSINDGKWYPEIFSARILAWINDEKGKKYVVDCGRYTVKDLGILSYIVRFSSVKMLLNRAPEQFHDAFNYGKISVDVHDDHAYVKMKDTAVDENACVAWTGVYMGILELTNKKGTVVEKQCQLKGASHCIFEVRWE